MAKTTIDKLMELKHLYEAGILTKDEMEVEKKKILGKNRESSKETQKQAEPITPQKQKEQIEVFELSNEETIDITDDTFFEKNKMFIFGGIATLIAIVVIIFLPKITSHSNSDILSANTKEELKEELHKDIFLKGIIGDKIGFSMRLHQRGNEIEGTEHYDSQNSDVNVSIKGSIADDGHMVLREFSNNVERGKFEGILDEVSYTGTFTNSKGKNMSFYAESLSEEDLAKEEEAVKKIGKNGSIIANVDGCIYYIEKMNTEKGYDADGEDCGKLYIYNIADRTISYEKILIPSGETFSIEDCKYRDMKITFVLYDVMRIGFGVNNFCTEVSQYNIKTNKWKAIAQACAKAEFVDNNKKIKLTTAKIINPDAEFSYEYEFEYSDEIIDI